MGKIKKRLGFWGLRRLTMEGKILIIKTVILPLLLLVSSVFMQPRKFLLDLEGSIFYVSWNSKWERLRREVLKKPKVKGGKAVPDLYLFLGSLFTAVQLKCEINPFKNPAATAMSRFWMGS